MQCVINSSRSKALSGIKEHLKQLSCFAFLPFSRVKAEKKVLLNLSFHFVRGKQCSASIKFLHDESKKKIEKERIQCNSSEY